MTQYEAIPHERIGPIFIGMSRKEVRKAFGKNADPFRRNQYSQGETDAFSTAGFYVDYEGQPETVEFVEVAPTHTSRFVLFGTDVFGKSAVDVISELREHAKVRKEENGHSFLLPKLDVSLWRQASEDDYFQALGVGRPGYFGEEAV